MTKYPNKSCKYPLPFPLPLVSPDQTIATLTACKTGNLAKGKYGCSGVVVRCWMRFDVCSSAAVGSIDMSDRKWNERVN